MKTVLSLIPLGAFFLMAIGSCNSLPEDLFVSESMIREAVERMGGDLDSYLDEVASSRIYGPSDYQDNLNLRDPEYLKHSSLWSNNYNQEEGGNSKSDDNNNEMKQENTLPAYCNPPNPCPLGYTAKDGCLVDFENTAVFSRNYQAQQECMCDMDHMYECNANRDNEITQIRRFVHHFQSFNPYLQGEKLPIAAKKGQYLN